MSWEIILKEKWTKRGDKYAHYADRDKPYQERTTGNPYDAMLDETIINNIAKDLNLPRGNYDLEVEDAIFVKLVAKTIDKYPDGPQPSGRYPSDVFYRSFVELDLEIEFNNLNIIEENTGTVIHTFKEEDIIINTDDIKIELGQNSFDFEVMDYHSGKLYVDIINTN